jgi:hypothetical protein
MLQIELNLLSENICNVAKNFSLKLWSVVIVQILFTPLASALGNAPQILTDHYCWVLFCIHLLHIINFSSKNMSFK